MGFYVGRRQNVGWIWLSAWLAFAGRAQGQAGTYTAQPARIEATVTDWGPDCGTRPQSYTTSTSPTVEVRMQGAHLSLVYPDRTLRTNACWSPNRTVKLTTTSAADNRWRTECRTPAEEVRKEAGRYTVEARGEGVLELIEESDYDWRLNASHCAAKVRITQRLERGAKSAAPAAKEEEPACVAGQAVRLRLRPLEARLEPGGRVCFQPKAFDQEGCSFDVPQAALRWELTKPQAARGTLAGGCFRAADVTAESEGTFRIVAAGEGLSAEAVVMVAAPDLSDITARRSASSTAVGATAPATPTFGGGLAGTGMSAVTVQSEPPLLWLVGLGALGLLTLGAAALFFVLRARKKPALAVPAEREEPVPAAPPAQEEARAPREARPPEQVNAQPVAVSGEPKICPLCRRGHAPTDTRCKADGTALLSYAEYAQLAKDSSARQCPGCGAALMPGAAFCGVCGTRLET